MNRSKSNKVKKQISKISSQKIMLKKICDDFKEKVNFSFHYPFDTHISAHIDPKCLENQQF